MEAAISAPQNTDNSKTGTGSQGCGCSCNCGTPAVKVPDYLEKTYWWAYVRPWAIKIFEREWLVDLILWGCYRRLRDAALRVFGDYLPGKTIQISCVYGSITKLLNAKVEASGGSLDVVDVVTHQLANLQRKLPAGHKVKMHNMDASDLKLPDATYDRALLFFLMHEQPRDVRERTLREAFRVVKPGGSVMIVEFAKPKWWHPLRYLWYPFLKYLEPFAPDIWNHEDISAWLPQPWPNQVLKHEKLFGDMYQVILIKV